MLSFKWTKSIKMWLAVFTDVFAGRSPDEYKIENVIVGFFIDKFAAYFT